MIWRKQWIIHRYFDKMRVKSCIIFLLVSIGLSAQSLTLEQCIARAIESSLQVKQGEQELASRRIQYNQARSDLLPTISGSVGQNWIFGKSIGADNVYHSNNSSQTTFSLNANLLLWDGLGMKYRIDMAKAQLQAQALSVEELQQDIRINICAMYLQVLLNKELLIVAENQQEDTRFKVERMQALVDANRMAAGELYSLQAQQAKEEYAVTQAQGNVMLSLLDLAQAMEEDYSPDFDIIMSAGEPIEGTLIPNNAEVYAYALEHRPEMLAAQKQLEATQAAVKSAKSAYSPTLSAGANFGTGYYNMNDGTGDKFGTQLKNNASTGVGLTLNVPIFTRMETTNNLRQQKLSVVKQQLQIDQIKKDLRKEIDQAYYNAVTAQAQYLSAEKAVRSSDEAYRYASEKYDAGKSTSYEYYEAKKNHQQILSEQLQAKYNYLFKLKILEYYMGKY